MGFGQIIALEPAVRQPQPEPPAGAQRFERLPQLEAFIIGIKLRVLVGSQTLQPVIVQDPDGGKDFLDPLHMNEKESCDPEQRNGQHIPCRQPADPEQGKKEGNQQGSCPQVPPHHDQHSKHADHAQQRKHDFFERGSLQRP